MPTLSTIAWETLLEPRPSDSNKNSVNSKQVTEKSDDDGKKEKKQLQTLNHIYISPALYITPEPTPIPESSFDSLSPSPYVVNRKRRGGGKAVGRRVDGFEVQQEQAAQAEESNSSGGDVDDSISKLESSLQLQQEVGDDNFLGVEIVEDRNESSVVEDDFFYPRLDSSSVARSTELNDFGKQAENVALMSNQGDFFDANEDFFSDGFSSYGPCMESELRATRLSLLEEIERRKALEDALGQMYSKWQRVGNLLSQAGLPFPTPSNGNSSLQLEIDSVEQFCQRLLVARFVAEAMGKGQARAEAEIAAEEIIGSKDQEISRLRDRLQYYEAVNHEMSQRNQEIIEVARRQRQRKKSWSRWLWGCVGLSVAVGISVIAYSYLPQTSELHPMLISGNSSDASCASSSESA